VIAILFALPVALLAIDRLLKSYALHSLPSEGVFWIPGLLGLERFDNHGLAFGIPVGNLTALVLSLVAGAALFYGLKTRKRGPIHVFSALLIFLGAISNFYDRLALGFVVDYLRLGPISFVNIADGMIVAGLLMIMIHEDRPKPSDG